MAAADRDLRWFALRGLVVALFCTCAAGALGSAGSARAASWDDMVVPPPATRPTFVSWAVPGTSQGFLRSHQLTIKSGDTLVDILLGLGVEGGEADAALKALRARYSPKRLQVGQPLLVTVSLPVAEVGAPSLLSLALGISPDREVNLRRQGDLFTVSVDPRQPDPDPKGWPNARRGARPEAPAGAELAPAEGRYLSRALRVGPHDVLADVLRAAEIDTAEAAVAIRAAAEVANPRALAPGEHVKIILHEDAGPDSARIAALSAPLAGVGTLLLIPTVGGGFTARILPPPESAAPAARQRPESGKNQLPTLLTSAERQYDPRKFGFATSNLALRAVPSLGEQAAEPAREPAAPAEPAARTVRSGETLLAMLTGAGVESGVAHEAIGAIRKVFDPRELQVGQAVQIALADTGGTDDVGRLARLSIAVRPDRDLVLERAAGGDYKVSWFDRPVLRTQARREGRIQSSLFEAAAAAGIPDPKTVELINLFSWDVDFQRDVQKGDRFEVLYEEAKTVDGIALAPGPIRYAALTLSGQRLAIYRYQPSDDQQADYFTAAGRSIRKALLRTPLDAVRVTSSYGMRMHPILGYNRMHRGVDFGAPTGTPIKAAGDGIVEFAGWFSGYGNYVRIKHNGKYATAYGHLSRFGGDIRTGARVRQGQIIGQVGMTGSATGPHLHYEVLVAGEQINPNSLKIPTGRELEGAELRRFKAAIARMDAEFDGLGAAIRTARATH